MEIKATFAPGNTTTPIAVEFVTYIGGDGYSAPVVVKSDGITQNYLYLHRDYQGSIIAITDGDGVVLEKRQFDAWGEIIKVQDGTGNNLNVLTILDRGYTGHEHLQSVGLINMNGRLYDPKLHRFLQPDNFVQDPSNTQNYNRYGYVLNNPLKYTDPSGENHIEYPGSNGGSDTGGNVNCPQCECEGWGCLIKNAAEFFKNPENGEWLRRNAGEIGRFLGRNTESAVSDLGKGLEDAGQFFVKNKN